MLRAAREQAFLHTANYSVWDWRLLPAFYMKMTVTTRVAQALAAQVITEKMFEPVGEEAFTAACRAIDEADIVIDTGCPTGQMNERVKELPEYAKAHKKQVLFRPDSETLRNCLLQ